MQVFVTGAAGFIGQATIKELHAHGHTVVGLARNDAHVSTITSLGATPLKGDLEDIESLKKGAKEADGVIHLAFVNDFANFARACAIDRAAISAMAEVMEGTNKPLVQASGTLMCPKGVLVTEDTPGELDKPPFSLRAQNCELVYQLSKEKGIRGSVIRLAPTVHADGKGGLTRLLIDMFHQKGGPVISVNDGSARWPACHRDDAAAVFRLALEKGKPGSTFHATAEEGVPLKEQMELVGKKLKLPVESRSLEEATSMLGFFAQTISADNPVSSEKTRKELGWQPKGQSLLEDFSQNFPY